MIKVETAKAIARRLPRGGVDRNMRQGIVKARIIVASRAEAWIETRISYRHERCAGVASRAEAWIETGIVPITDKTAAVASRAEAWIETRLKLDRHFIECVASRAEAWIETSTF